MAWRRVVSAAQPVLVALAFVLLALLLRRQWDSLREHEWGVSPGWLVLSALCITAVWLTEIVIWRRFLGVFRQRLPYGAALRIWFASTIVRYVPGSVWQPLSLATRCQAEGVRAEAAVASLTSVHLVHLLAVIPIAIVYLVVWGDGSAVAQWRAVSWVSVAIGAAAAYLIARPARLMAVADMVARRLGRPPLSLALTTADLLAALAISLAGWVAYIVGFIALALALLPRPLVLGGALPHIAAAYPLAFVVGFVSVITPSGLVVREGMLLLLLAPSIGGGNAALLALAMRVWELVLDGAVSGAALLWTRLTPKPIC